MAAVVPGPVLVFGPATVVDVVEGKRALVVLVDDCKAGSVAEVNGRVVAMDVDHTWHDVDTPFDGVALLVDQWVTS